MSQYDHARRNLGDFARQVIGLLNGERPRQSQATSLIRPSSVSTSVSRLGS